MCTDRRLSMKAALLFRPEQHLGLGPRSQEGWGLTTEA